MAGGVTQEIAELVKVELNSFAWTDPPTFTAERKYRSYHNKNELDELRVDVVAAGIPKAELNDRGMVSDEHHTIHIGFKKKLVGKPEDESGAAEIDALAEFIEQVRDHFRRAKYLPGDSSVKYVSQRIPLLWDPDELKRNNFLSRLELTFQLFRE